MKYILKEKIIGNSYLSRLYNLVSKETGFPWFFLSDDISYSDTQVDNDKRSV